MSCKPGRPPGAFTAGSSPSFNLRREKLLPDFGQERFNITLGPGKCIPYIGFPPGLGLQGVISNIDRPQTNTWNTHATRLPQPSWNLHGPSHLATSHDEENKLGTSGRIGTKIELPCLKLPTTLGISQVGSASCTQHRPILLWEARPRCILPSNTESLNSQQTPQNHYTSLSTSTNQPLHLTSPPKETPITHTNDPSSIHSLSVDRTSTHAHPLSPKSQETMRSN